MTAQDLLGQLRGVTGSGPNSWTALAPCHQDTNSSFKISQVGNKILVKCYAGCDFDTIVAALGVEPADLFADGRPQKPVVLPPPTDRVLVATYDYVDATGDKLLYQVCRYDPKTFRQRRPDGNNGWTWQLGDVQRVIYKLPELLEQEQAIFVEGEKDADRLWSVGLPATTTVSGSSAWKDDYALQFVDAGIRELVIIPDNDEPGETYAAKVALACSSAGLRTKIVRLPGIQAKGDVSDFLNTNTKDALELVIKAVEWVEPRPPELPVGLVHISVVLRELEERLLAGPVPALRTPFPTLNAMLAGGFRPGELVYLGGKPGSGKTLIALLIAREAASDGNGIVIISREMVNTAITSRILSQTSKISATRLRSGLLLPGEFDLVRAFSAKLGKLPIWMTDKALTLMDIEKITNEFRQQPPIGCLVVDYLQLLRASPEITDSRQIVEAISLGLKTIAVSMRIPVICISSLTRGTGPDRGTKKPDLSDLRNSGQLEFDADVVLLLSRQQGDAVAELNVAKNREGATGAFDLVFDDDAINFAEASMRLEEKNIAEAQEVYQLGRATSGRGLFR